VVKIEAPSSHQKAPGRLLELGGQAGNCKRFMRFWGGLLAIVSERLIGGDRERMELWKWRNYRNGEIYRYSVNLYCHGNVTSVRVAAE
jgi:hypothetical protein